MNVQFSSLKAVIRAVRKQFVFLMQEIFALHFNAVLILFLFEQTGVLGTKRVCPAAQESGGSRVG